MMDSFSVLVLPMPTKFGDVGANTLGHIAKACAAGGDRGPWRLNLPNLSKLGLGHAGELASGTFPAGLNKDVEVIGAYGFAQELSRQAGTPRPVTGRLPACPSVRWGYFHDHHNSFPARAAGCHRREGRPAGHRATATPPAPRWVLDDLGEEHMRTGKPILTPLPTPCSRSPATKRPPWPREAL